MNHLVLLNRLCRMAGVSTYSNTYLPTLEEACDIARQYLTQRTEADIVAAMLQDNYKLRKGRDKVTAIVKGVSLSPANRSGKQLCAFSTKGCRSVCLADSGHGSMTSVTDVRLARTLFLQEHTGAFLRLLCEAVGRHAKNCARVGAEACVRLNVLSDIPWEYICPWLFTMYPDVQFYDYTKVHVRLGHTPSNYHLTLSYTGYNGVECAQWLGQGGNVAAVCDIKSRGVGKTATLPSAVRLDGMMWAACDGDVHDIRPYDGVGKVALLRYKPSAGATMSDAGRFLLTVSDKVRSRRSLEVVS